VALISVEKAINSYALKANMALPTLSLSLNTTALHTVQKRLRGTSQGGIQMKALLAGLLATVVVVPAQAETNAPIVPAPVQPQAVAVIVDPVAQNILRAGTEVPLLTRENLTTKEKKLRVGQRVQLEVAAPVISGGITVIPAGTPAIAELTEVRNKGMWGKSGYIGARVISLRLGDRQIRLSGSFDDKGVTGTGGVVAAIAFVPIAGFLTTGTSAQIPSGSAVKGFLDEDIVFRAAPAQVLEVPAPAPTSVSTPVIQPVAVTK